MERLFENELMALLPEYVKAKGNCTHSIYREYGTLCN